MNIKSKVMKERVSRCMLDKFTITYIVNKKDTEYSYCYADSKERAVKIAKRMVDANYYFVKVEQIIDIPII